MRDLWRFLIRKWDYYLVPMKQDNLPGSPKVLDSQSSGRTHICFEFGVRELQLESGSGHLKGLLFVLQFCSRCPVNPLAMQMVFQSCCMKTECISQAIYTRRQHLCFSFFAVDWDWKCEQGVPIFKFEFSEYGHVPSSVWPFLLNSLAMSHALISALS